MSDIRLGRDRNNDEFITINIRNIKTDQFNEGDFKTPKMVGVPVCPVQAIARLISLREWTSDSDAKVFGSWLGNRLSATLRIAGSAIGIPASRIGNHPLRSGGGHGHVGSRLRYRGRKTLGPLEVGFVPGISAG